MGLEFTEIFIFKTDSKLAIDPDDQIVQMVKMLDGELKTWQVLAPTPSNRVLYFEMKDGKRPSKLKGSAETTRKQMVEGKPTRIRRKNNG